MKTLFISLLSSFILFSCAKDNGTYSWLSEARYTVTFTGKWQTPSFAVPPGAHFTTMAGMVHNQDGKLWAEGTQASKGTEDIAEIGNLVKMLEEIDAMISAKKASSLIIIVPPSAPNLSSATTIYCNNNFSRVSFASMLGPTPDWFTGINGVNLYDGTNWIKDTTVNLYVYDAGTEDGDVFSTNNIATVPQQNIQLLTPSKATVLANGNSSLGPIATVRFTRQ